MKTAKTQHIVLTVVLVIVGVIFIVPPLFMVVASFKNNETQIMKDMSSLLVIVPYGEIGTLNYSDLFGRMPYFKFFFNSVIITFFAVSIGIVFNSMMAYALARLNFRGKKILLTVIVAMIIIPIEAIIIPLYLEAASFGWVDTFIAQIIPFTADAFIVFLFYQSFLSLPKSLDEACIVDGAGYGFIYARIVMPLSKPIIATVMILNSLPRWGDVLWPALITREEQARPLALAMQQLFTQQPRMWGDIFAFTTLSTLPVLALFIFFQNQFIRSIAGSGIKG